MVEPRKGPRQRDRSTPKNTESGSAAAESMDQLVLTTNPPTHEIVKIEKIDRTGKRQELSEQDWLELVGDDAVTELAGAVQDAFEAGLAEGLAEREEVDDLDEEIVLWQLLATAARATH